MGWHGEFGLEITQDAHDLPHGSGRDVAQQVTALRVKNLFRDVMAHALDVAADSFVSIRFDSATDLRPIFTPVEDTSQAWFLDVIRRRDFRYHRVFVRPDFSKCGNLALGLRGLHQPR